MTEREGAGPALRRTWQESPGWGVVLVLAYVLLAALPVVLAFALNPASGEPFLEEMGKGAALLGFALLALQAALSARLKAVDRPFGLDVVMQFHRAMAVFAGALLVLHPVLLALGERSFHLFAFDTPWQVVVGKAALAVLVLAILMALFFKKLGLQYQVWRFLHKGVIVVVILGFIHSMAIGPDLRPMGMRVYWWLLLGMTLGLFAYRNAFVPLWGRRRFRVASVQPETHNTYTLTLEPEDGRPLPHRPGQFMFITLHRPGRPSEEHPFTIRSSPTEELPIRLTIKESGDFTNTIGQTTPGDTAGVEAPYGRFSFVYHQPAAFLFIAGGIGITPIMSMLRSLVDSGDRRRVVLIWANRTERDIAFQDELARLLDHMKVVQVLSEGDPGWGGLRGHVTDEIIKDQAGDLLEIAHVYLCGPPPMMDNVIESLRNLGVDDRRIHYERFAI